MTTAPPPTADPTAVPRPLPLLGHLRAFARDPIAFADALHAGQGDVARWRLGPREQTVLFHPDDVGRVLLGTGSVLRKGFSDGFSGWAGLVGAQGLASSEGELWRRQRRLAQPAMHPRRIAGYAATMARAAADTVAGWRDGEVRDLHRDMVRLTQRIAVATLFGAEVGTGQSDVVSAALDEFDRRDEAEQFGVGGLLPPWVPTPNRARLRRASARVEELVLAAVARRADHAPGQGPDDLLQMLLDARDDDGRPMPPRLLRDEIMILYVAGHETTAGTMGFLLAELARRPELQERLHAELDAVLDGADPAFAHVARLPLAGALVSETLRLWPIAPMLPRKVVTAIPAGDRELPPGADVWVCQWVTQRDPRWWPDPTAFRPDRWLDGSADAAPRHAWFPFGGGQRICLGQRFAQTEAVLLLASALRGHRLETVVDTPVRPATGSAAAAAGGAVLRLRRRGV